MGPGGSVQTTRRVPEPDATISLLCHFVCFEWLSHVWVVVTVIALTLQLTKFDSRSLESMDLDERDSPASPSPRARM